ncbi:MAG: MFS transporter [Acidobacteria bacterium]|nr:MFS transporter [Acidobacteriota bacterium]
MSVTPIESTTAETYTLKTKVVLVGVAMALLAASLEGTVVGTAMPTVIATLGGIEIYSWVFAAYILASTVMTPIWGKMADLIGRRPAMFGGLALFMLGSALSGAAQSMPQLIVFRIIQGLGAAALFPIGMTIVSDLLTMEQRMKMIPLFSSMWGIASLIGPTIGGYLTEYTRWSWRSCFYVVIPFGLLSLGMIRWAYREKYERRQNISFDYAGTITLTVALSLLLIIVERGAEFSWQVTAGLAFVVALSTIAFLRIEQNHKEPLLPLGLFRIRFVLITILHGFFVMMALIGTMSFLPLFVQAVIGTNAAEAGKILTPFILPWVVTAAVGGRLVLRWGYRLPVMTGMVMLLIGAALLAKVSVDTTRSGLSLAVIFMGMGGGLTVATLMIGAQHSVPRTQIGVTTAAVQFARNIGAAFGAGLMGAVMNWRLRHSLATATGELVHFSESHQIGSIIRPETRASLSAGAAEFLRTILAGSLQLAFLFVLVAVIAATIIGLLIPRGGAHDLAHQEHQDESLAEEASAGLPEL